jgi:hypothetical protein
MKLKKLFTLSLAILAFTMFGYAQQEQAEAPMFGGTRATAFSHDFKDISGKAMSYQFKIVNSGNTTMWVKDIQIPERVGVTILSKKIDPKSEGVLSVTIDPTIAEKGKFTQKIVVITEQSDQNIKTIQEITFEVLGEIK